MENTIPIGEYGLFKTNPSTGNVSLYIRATNNDAGQPMSPGDIDGINIISDGFGGYYKIASPSGGGPFTGGVITRTGPFLGLNITSTTFADWIKKFAYPAVQPIDAFNIDGQTNEQREIGGSTSYTLNWGVTRETNPITIIVIDGTVIAPTGNSQSGVQNGNVGAAVGSYTKFMNAAAAPDAPITASVTLAYSYQQFWDTVAAAPANSAQVRALASSMLTNNGNQFTINTGTVNKTFVVVLPPGKNIVSVIDQDALNLNITALYIGTAISVNDAGGTPRAYTLYTYTQAVPYGSNHRHLVTTN